MSNKDMAYTMKSSVPVISLFIILTTYITNAATAQIPDDTIGGAISSSQQPPQTSVLVKCRQSDMLVTVTAPGPFSGMVYPRGLGKNSSCLVEFALADGPMEYTLPLRSCNTMPKLLEDGAVEYFNTIVVQPHLKLVTGQGKAYHVRCRYRSRDRVNTSEQSSKQEVSPQQPLQQTARRVQQGRSLGHHQVNVVLPSSELPMPGCTMQIFSGDPATKEVAQNVKIGDSLTLVVEMDAQDQYGLMVTDCSVRDGLGWAEQRLVDSEGCSVDNDIMGLFEYSDDQSKAQVTFPAHKFPYTASVYYQCNAKLCSREKDGCQKPSCDLQRIRRAADDDKPIVTSKANGADPQDDSEDGAPATIQVYSGLYVNEGAELAGSEEDDVYKEKTPDDALCVSQRAFAVGIAVAGLLLMLAVLAAILVIMARRHGKGRGSRTGSSSVYSGPYTNTAYSHSS